MGEIAHAKLSASGAHRWMACPASVREEEGIPNKNSPYAAEGTLAHDAAAQFLEGKGMSDGISEDMQAYVLEFVAFVKEFEGDLLVEERVDFSRWVPGGFGTSDVVIIAGDHITVIDLKYGQGVKVEAKQNPQLRLYGLGALEKFGIVADFKTIDMYIHQPRLGHISGESLTVDELIAWADEEVAPSAKRALSEDAPHNPGEKQCRFCNASATCPALRNKVLETAIEGFDVDTFAEGDQPLETVDVPQDDTSELAKYLDILPLIEVWSKAVREKAHDLAVAGEEIPGYVLTSSKGNRKWVDEAEVENLLRDKFRLKKDLMYQFKLLSPTQVEKQLKRVLTARQYSRVQALVIRPEGAPKLVKDKDGVKPLAASAKEGFETN